MKIKLSTQERIICLDLIMQLYENMSHEFATSWDDKVKNDSLTLQDNRKIALTIFKLRALSLLILILAKELKDSEHANWIGQKYRKGLKLYDRLLKESGIDKLLADND